MASGSGGSGGAASTPQSQAEAIYTAASRLEAGLADAVVAMMGELFASAELDKIIAMLEAGDIAGLVGYLKGLQVAAFEPLAAELTAAMVAGATVGEKLIRDQISKIPQLSGIAITDGAGAAVMQNPAAMRHASTYRASLLSGWTQQMGEKVMEVVAEGLNEGIGPRQTAVKLKQSLPHTRQGIKAISNYRAALEGIGNKAGGSNFRASGWGLYTPRQIAVMQRVNPATYRMLDFSPEEKLNGRRYGKISRAAGTGAPGADGVKPSDPLRQQSGANAFRIDADGKPQDQMTRWRLRNKQYDPIIYRVVEAEERLSLAVSSDERFKAQAALDKARKAVTEATDKMVSAYDAAWRRHRAETVARTESLRSLAIGNDEMWQYEADRLGNMIRVIKRWWTARDERVRHAHRAMHGKAVEMSEWFAEPAGTSAEEVAASGHVGNTSQVRLPPSGHNCRCTTIYEVEPL